MKRFAFNIRVWSLTTSIFLGLPLWAITDSSYILKTVEVKSMRYNFSKSNFLNEVYTTQALQSQWSDLFIRNSGVGQLSTISFRGLSPQNIAIFWEGVPINSPTNGLLNLNHLPNGLLQNTTFSSEDNRLTSAGTIDMSKSSHVSNRLAISSTAYLSELFSHKIDGDYQINKSRISFFNQLTHGRNQYEYLDNAGQHAKLQHNGVQQLNSQVLFTQSFAKFDLNLGAWYQNIDTKIPDFYFDSTGTILNRNWRSYVGISNRNIDAKLVYAQESQQYNSLAYGGQETRYKVHSYKGVFKYRDSFGDRWNLQYQLYPSLHNISFRDMSAWSSDSVETTIHEAIQEIGLEYKMADKWAILANVKSQVHTHFNNLFFPSLSLRYQPSNRLQIGLTGDVNGRNPSFDELYYPLFSNQNLKPEINYQLRNTWKYHNENSLDKIQLSAEPYYIHSRDKIVSLPDSGYRPFNVDRVTTWGLHTQMEWVRRLSYEHLFRTVFGLNVMNNSDYLGRHLPNVPQLKSTLTLQWMYQSYEVLMVNNYTAPRYTSVSTNAQLAAYWLTNLKFTYKQPISKSAIHWSIGVDNLWGENYQEVVGGYMPLRNYYLNFTAILR